MAKRRIERLNSLLKEVISEVIMKEVKNPHINSLFSITQVAVTQDLRHAKVYVSVIGNATEKQQMIEQLQAAAGFIAVRASKKIVTHHFPSLTFFLDDSVEKHLAIEEILGGIARERERRDEP